MLEKLEAMTCVCSVGLDMVAIPGNTSVDTLAGIIADEMAIGMINNKTTATRSIGGCCFILEVACKSRQPQDHIRKIGTEQQHGDLDD